MWFLIKAVFAVPSLLMPVLKQILPVKDIFCVCYIPSVHTVIHSNKQRPGPDIKSMLLSPSDVKFIENDADVSTAAVLHLSD